MPLPTTKPTSNNKTTNKKKIKTTKKESPNQETKNNKQTNKHQNQPTNNTKTQPKSEFATLPPPLPPRASDVTSRKPEAIFQASDLRHEATRSSRICDRRRSACSTLPPFALHCPGRGFDKALVTAIPNRRVSFFLSFADGCDFLKDFSRLLFFYYYFFIYYIYFFMG